MTGCQGNPCNGVTLSDQVRGANPLDIPAGKQLDIEVLCRALGVDDVVSVNSQDLKAVKSALKEAVGKKDTLSVLVFHSPCRLIDRTRKHALTVSDCKSCGLCVKLGCPAIGTNSDGQAVIDKAQCIGCEQCSQVCPFGCIAKEGE